MLTKPQVVENPALNLDENQRNSRLLGAVRRRFGEKVRIENLVSATLGGSNRTILFDLCEQEGSARRLVLRQETYAMSQSPFLAPHQQFRLLELLHSGGIPVPEPVFELDDADGLGRGYVVECVIGETLPKRLMNDSEFSSARSRFAMECGEILARLHAIDLAGASFLVNVPDSKDPVAAQTARYDSYSEAYPAIELGLRWLHIHRPQASKKHLLHGDFRNGNLIVDRRGIRAVLDWECAHLGDAMEDIGWLCTRSWRFGNPERPVGGIGTRDEFAAAYHSNGGVQIDWETVHWWGVFGLVRWAILNVMQAHGHIGGQRRAISFAACGRNICVIEYDLMMTLSGDYD